MGVNDDVLRHPPLSHTAEQGLDEVVKILGAQHDVEVNSKDVYGHLLLFYTTRCHAVHNRSQGSIVFPDDHIMCTELSPGIALHFKCHRLPGAKALHCATPLLPPKKLHSSLPEWPMYNQNSMYVPSLPSPPLC